MGKYFIKRCIGIPRDTLRIVNGIYTVHVDPERQLGNYTGKQMLSNMSTEMFLGGVYHTFPWDSVLNWNIKDFGPIYIPKKGDQIILDRTNALLYKNIIEWEKGYSLSFENDTLQDNGEPLLTYRFSHHYYFMGEIR